MKIGVMLRHLGEKGGIAVYTENILEALLDLDGANEYVMLHKDPRLAGRHTGRANVRELVLRAPSRLLWDQVAVPRCVRREGLDLVFQPKLSIPLFASCRKVFVLHGAEQFAVPEIFPWHNRLYNRIMMPLYCRRADAVISTTETGSVDIVRLVGVDPSNIHVIYEAQHERFRPVPGARAEGVRAKYGLPDRYLLFVGGINPLKNFGNLLKAFARVKEKVPHHLVVAGFNRWGYERELELCRELGLQERVHSTGFVPDEDLPAIYTMADLLVFPSLYEGFGIPVLEAMACGCPVITSNTGCSPEVAGDAALLVNPREPDRIAGAIAELLQNESLRQELRKKGLKRAERFSWRKAARQTLALFERLVHGGGSGG